MVEDNRDNPKAQTPKSREKSTAWVVFSSAAFSLNRLPKLLPRPA
jgi:hypothetical protein